MQGKDICYQAVRQASNPNYPSTNLWLASMTDSKHTLIMANTWSTTLPKAKRKRRVGPNLVKIDYSKYMYYYYFGCHAVDDNNNNRQGRLSLEETFAPDRWDLRHLGWVIALTQVNSMLAYNIFNRKPNNSSFFTKAQFTQDLSESLISTEDIRVAHVEGVDYCPPTTRGPPQPPEGAKFCVKNDPSPYLCHCLCKLKKNRGVWNGEEFPLIATQYSKVKGKDCQQRDIRTFCFCSWKRMLCSQCHGKHVAEVAQKEDE